MREPRDERRLVAVLLALGAVLRLAVVIAAVGGPYDPYSRLEGDTADYLSLGMSLSRGEGYSFHYRPWLRETLEEIPVSVGPSVPTAMRSPGYPGFLAAVFAVAGARLHLVTLLQAALSALVPLFVYLTARQLKAPAVPALAFAVFYVPFWLDAAYVMSECLLTFCAALALWLLVRPGSGFAAGVAAGGAILVKSVTAPFFLLAGLLLDRRRALAYAAGLACLVGPWAFRNSRHTGRPAVAPAVGGYQVFLLHNSLNRDLALFARPGDQNEGYPGLAARVAEVRGTAPRLADPVAREYAMDAALLHEAARFVRAEPGQALRAVIASLVNTWRIDTPLVHSKPGLRAPTVARWVSHAVLYGGLAPFVLLGIVVSLRDRRGAPRVVGLYLVTFVLVHAGMSAQIRHRVSAMPAFFVMAAYGLGVVGAWRRSRPSSGAPLPPAGDASPAPD